MIKSIVIESQNDNVMWLLWLKKIRWNSEKEDM